LSLKKRLRVFAGPNGSGKSTFLRLLKAQWIGPFVNADLIEKTIRDTHRLDLEAFRITRAPGERLQRHYQASEQLRRAEMLDTVKAVRTDGTVILFEGLQGPVNSYLAAATAEFIRLELLDLGISFTFETVMSHPSKVAFMKEAQSLGYRTYLYFVATESPTINVARVQQRVDEGGHPVQEDKIVERYSRSIDLMLMATTYSNRAYIYDNSGAEHELIAEITDGKDLEAKTDALPNWFAHSSLWAAFKP
jgi:predicted ABC-type ATPase